MDKFIITTALFGAYDSKILTLNEIQNYEEYKDKFEFHMFTNQLKLKSPLWKIHHVKKLPVENDNPRSAYYFKTVPHRVHHDYKIDSPYSVWIDSSAIILDLKSLWEMCEVFLNSSKNLFIEKHPSRDCVYDELEANIILQKDDEGAMRRHVMGYKNEGYPANFGMVETGFQIRNISNEKFQEFSSMLWREITNKTRRDQLSWNYCVWKLGFNDFKTFSIQEKHKIVVFQDHPNRASHKERILLVGPWLGEKCFEEQWRDYVTNHIISNPYDKIIVGCRSGSQHLYQEFSDKFIIDDRDGVLHKNLINGKVPVFDLPQVQDKELTQLNATNDICSRFSITIPNARKIHILWATIRPEMFKSTYKYWLREAVNPQGINIHIAVDTEEQREQLKEFKDSEVIIVANNIKGVTYPCYVLSKNLKANPEDIVIFASDDFFPMPKWDVALFQEFKDFDGALLVDDRLNSKYGIVTIPIMMYSTLQKMNGIIYHPAYTHCWSDNELLEVLSELKILKNITDKPEVYFEHRHYSNGMRVRDASDIGHSERDAIDKQTYNTRKSLSVQDKLKVNDTKKLSILICTLPERKDSLKNLLDSLNPQQSNDVEILTYSDNRTMTVGEKRNKLLSIARGTYICFIDDDDIVSDNYVSEILKAIETNPDCCSLRGMLTGRKSLNGAFEHSIKYDQWETKMIDNNKLYCRCPNHLNVVKKELALKVGFKDISNQEDIDYSTRLKPLLHTEVEIKQPLYCYQVRPS